MKKYLHQAFLLATFIIAARAQAYDACGFSIESTANFKLIEKNSCEFDMKGHKNYANMNSLIIFENKRVDYILTYPGYTYDYGGERYFSFDEIDDPYFTRHTIKNEPLKQVYFDGAHGYIAEWTGFMQMLSHYKKNDGYSLNVRCVSAAIGDESHALQTRFCAPHTTKGDALVEEYKAMILKARLTDH